jgi:hypothetical protein
MSRDIRAFLSSLGENGFFSTLLGEVANRAYHHWSLVIESALFTILIMNNAD